MSPNLGPEWFWYLIFICALVGFIGGIVMIVKGIIWIINHIHFT
jgi:hypothetical protein